MKQQGSFSRGKRFPRKGRPRTKPWPKDRWTQVDRQLASTPARSVWPIGTSVPHADLPRAGREAVERVTNTLKVSDGDTSRAEETTDSTRTRRGAASFRPSQPNVLTVAREQTQGEGPAEKCPYLPRSFRFLHRIRSQILCLLLTTEGGGITYPRHQFLDSTKSDFMDNLSDQDNRRFAFWSAALLITISAGFVGSACSDAPSGPTEKVIDVEQQRVTSGARFGSYQQGSFQNGWRGTIPQAATRTTWFNNELDDTDQKIFSFNLTNKKYFLERYGDHQPDNMAPDDVDLLWINTHGGAWTNPTTSTFAMWEQSTSAYTTEMRLGDSATWGGGLSVLVAYACEILKNSDGHLGERLSPMFAGGLKIALGSHDTLYDDATTNESGEDFADNIQHHYSFKFAWYDALTDWKTDNDVAVVASGTNPSDCYRRKDDLNWQNYGGFSFLRNGDMAYLCWTTWDNI